MIEMQNFQDTFKTRKRSFISAFSIFMTVPLKYKYFVYNENFTLKQFCTYNENKNIIPSF